MIKHTALLVALVAVLGVAAGMPKPSYGAPAVAASAPPPAHLQCENRPVPLGLDSPRPRLSWLLPWPGRGRSQSAYQVLVASTPQRLARGQGDLWDSGKVAGAASAQVAYAGAALASGQDCFWRVRAWDEHGVASPWSRASHWSVGLLKAADWQGVWIGLSNPKAYQPMTDAQWVWYPEGHPEQSAPAGDRYFRRQFVVPADRDVKSGVVQMTADNSFVLSLNGEEVGEGSDFNNAPLFDVTARLRPGLNTLAVRATNSGTTPTPAGLIGLLRVDFTRGGPLIVPTDGQWKSVQAAPEGWTTPAFDDSAWVQALPLGKYGISPWNAFLDPNHTLPARYLRREFVLDKPLKRARVSFCGLGLSELYVNGRKVGDAVLSPALSQYDKRCYYVTYDVTRDLTDGRNALGVVLGNGRFYSLRGGGGLRDFGVPRLLLQLNITYADGSRMAVTSDSRWRATDQGPIRSNNEYDGETYDARMELTGWDRPGFDDGAWGPAERLPAPGGTLSAQPMRPIRVVQTLRPVAITRPAPGVAIFDMGQNMAGWCRLTVAGPAGTTVRLRFGEKLQPDGGLFVANLRSALATDTYTLRGGGVETYRPRFTYHGFRYVEVTGFPGTPNRGTLEAEVIRDDLPVVGGFTCSDPLVNRIYHNAFWGVQSNYRSIPTDCPQRDERQGWLGDRSAEARGESYLFDVDDFYDKWVQDMADSQNAQGSISDVCPNYYQFYFDDLTWPSSMIIIPGMLYDQYGDRRALATHYPAMRRWIVHMETYARDGLMLRDSWGDWQTPADTVNAGRPNDGGLLGTTYYYKCLTLMARYATVLGRTDDAREYQAEAARVVPALNTRYWHPSGGTYDSGSQTSSVLPLAFGMVPDDRKNAAFGALVGNITRASQDHIGTGLVGTQWIMGTLTAGGRPDVAYDILTQTTYPSWGYMVRNGASTVWELWDGDTAGPGMNSGNHVMLLGDLVQWLYEDVAGIAPDPARPGFQHCLMRPRIVRRLGYVRAWHTTPYGTFRSGWSRDGHRLEWRVTVPANTSATLYVPAKDAAAVLEAGRPAVKSEGVKFVGKTTDAVVYEVGSGSYVFTVPTDQVQAYGEG